MARYISFAILFAILIVVGALFYRVMVGFFVPVFMAVVLVVVFRPLHRWVLAKVGGRDHIAASITTLLIVTIVLLPTALVLSLAAVQGAKLIENLNEASIRVGLSKLRANNYLNLESPCANTLQSIQSKVLDIQEEVSKTSSYVEVTNAQSRMAGDVLEIRNQLGEIPKQLNRFAADKLEQRIVAARAKNGQVAILGPVENELRTLLATAMTDLRAITDRIPEVLEDADALLDLGAEKDQLKLMPVGIRALSDQENQWLSESRQQYIDLNFNAQIAIARMNRTLGELTYSEEGNLARLEESVWQLVRMWQDVRESILGGRLIGFLKDIANPSTDKVREILQDAVSYLQPRLVSFGGDSVAFLVKLLVGFTILLLSLYFFLCDGPGMVRTIMDLSPLDDRYEMELLAEFDRTSRAIVLATILSAIAQGLTAGVGYYFTGMPSLVMLTALTTICALIPFFGTGLVWVPVCLYLAIYEERFWAAGLLAAWGLLVVGTVDNLIKVLILHGQSQLHPLLALLSVLGGIQALGPIGIVVGPLVVTLLQTTLTIISHELKEIHESEEGQPHVEDKISVGKSLSEMIRKVRGVDPASQASPSSGETADASANTSADTPSSPPSSPGNALGLPEPNV